MSGPAPACRHYRLGACLLAERRNPGLDRNQACLRLDRLMSDFDAFLDRAEAFGLSERDAARIWDGRRHKALEAPRLCPHPNPGGIGQSPGGGLDCLYLFRLACLLRMARCTGRCEFFSKPPDAEA